MRKKSLIIFGSARSGTSWLAETLSRPTGFRLLFEPDHPDHVEGAESVADRFLEPHTRYPEVDKFFQQVLTNKKTNDWIAQNSFRKFRFHKYSSFVRRFVVKLIRCNLALPYLTRTLQSPSIFVVRDPYDVIESQLRVGFPWLRQLDTFKLAGLPEGFLPMDPQPDWSQVQKLAYRWSIENLVATRLLSVYDVRIKVVRYEDLKGQPENIRKMLGEMNFHIDENLDSLLTRPSSKTHPRSELFTRTKNELTSYEKDQIRAVLDQFDYTTAE